MARRTKEEAQQTRCHIMNTALDLFCHRGLAKTSLTDIAKAADLTRGAIYWHFKNKEELFISLWQELCQPLSHQLDASLNPDEPDPLGRLRFFLHNALLKITRDPGHRQMFTIMYSLETIEIEGEAFTLREHINKESRRFAQDIERSLANGVKHGQLPATLDLTRAATLLHCTLDGYILNWLHFPERIDLAREADYLLDSLFLQLRHLPARCD
ncbi:TetR family transcriptional regulator [Aeromonas sp. BIGb0445]|jgi:TetR/AcrR family transcriptional regulator, acrAB operon repressor|uniref:TetR family transcriptional regulator n=1 Tax=Aeromonas sp. BIGb0445 TaxID=2940593 RepID=UPI002169818C|nr:TetR family transcriptional regulator [Aeromonas sp. BIGb0445]MCS3459407.1 TetR/AcrR family acrAB operon transcriptional repressor [Aeromonas sp. BIGb0445]